MSLDISEIFYSIQGESSFAGLPCVFVRLSGCNLRCTYCDTGYAREGGEHLCVDEILGRLKAFPCRLAEVTGGEPLLQRETPGLVRRLLDSGYTVLMETNGSRDIGLVDPRCRRIVDVKCPSSGEADTFDRVNQKRLADTDELKFVIGDRRDYEYARAELKELPPGRRSERTHFSPVFEKMPLSQLADWMLADGLPAKLSPQLHRVIWPECSRGR